MTEAVRRVRGRLAPEHMFPAGLPALHSSRITLRDGLALRVVRAGPSEGPAVLLLHGWGASAYMWRDWFGPLAAAGFRVVAADLPGHGLSDKPVQAGACTLARQLDVVRQLLDAEQLDDAHVVAQSMAGTIALELVLADAARIGRLALVNPAAFGRVRLQRLAALVSPRALDRVLGRLVPRWTVARAHRLAYADGSRITERDVDEYWAPSQDSRYARAMRGYLREFAWRRAPADELAARLTSLSTPALAVLSGRDRLVRDAMPYVARLRTLGAPIDVLELPRGGHAVNEEEPDAVIPRVLAHFASA